MTSGEKVTLTFQVKVISISEEIDEEKPHVKMNPPSQGQRAQVQLVAPVELMDQFALEAEQVAGQEVLAVPVVQVVEPGVPVAQVAQVVEPEAPVVQAAQVEAPVEREVQVDPVEQVEPAADVCTYA